MIALIKDDKESNDATIEKREGIIHVMSPAGEVKQELIASAYYYNKILRLKFSPDGKTLVAIYGFSNGLAYATYDLGSWESKTAGRIGQTDKVLDFDISKDGNWLALATRHVDGQVFIVESNKMNTVALERSNIKGHGISVAFSIFSPNGNNVYSGWVDGAIIAWNVAGHQSQWRGNEVLKPSDGITTTAALSIDGLNLSVAWSRNHESGITLYNTNTWEKIDEIDANVCALTYAKSGQLLGLDGTDRSKVYVWAKKNFELETTLDLDSQSSEAFFSPEGHYVIGHASGSERLDIWKIY